MRLGHLFAAGMVGLCAAACDSVLGADFSGYQAAPTQCDPLNPTGGAPTYDACTAGQRCSSADGTSFSCASVSGTVAPYGVCNADSDCPYKYGCIQVGHLPDTNSTPVKVCLQWATDPSTCSAPEQLLSLPAAPIVGGKTYGSCFAPCDAIHPTQPSKPDFRTCGGGERCSIVLDATGVNSVDVCTPLASPPGVRDDYCTSDEDCGVGLACRNFTVASHCLDYCQTLKDCPSGRPCLPFTNKRYASLASGGEVDYSYCGPPAPCDPFTNTGCTSSQACDLLDDNYSVCVAPGPGVPGDQCQSSSDCKRGEWCIGQKAYGYYCSDVCRVGMTDCGAATCYSLSTKESIGSQEYGYCNPPSCDPFDPTGASAPWRDCPDGTCHFINSTSTACRAGGSAAEGASCTNSVDCGPDLFCIFFGTPPAGQCRTPCRVAMGSGDCTSSAPSCTALKTPFVINGTQYGYCN